MIYLITVEANYDHLEIEFLANFEIIADICESTNASRGTIEAELTKYNPDIYTVFSSFIHLKQRGYVVLHTRSVSYFNNAVWKPDLSYMLINTDNSAIKPLFRKKMIAEILK